jgi:hypothetical protein
LFRCFHCAADSDNKGLKGTEFAGWELVKTSFGETPVECSYWRNALSHHIPRGKVKTAKIGDVQHVRETLFLVDDQGGEKTV